MFNVQNEMNEPKRYEIDSFSKLINVANKDNVERLAIDLAGWLLYITDVLDNIREKHPQETEGKLNSEIVEAHFIWIDDNKHDMKGVRITQSETGETSYIDFEKQLNNNII
jgi:broad specificity phosphatase PhoE